jgi:hypothetical protein
MDQPTEREFVLSADCAGIEWWSKGARNEMRDYLKLLRVHRINVDELPNTHTDVSLSTAWHRSAGPQSSHFVPLGVPGFPKKEIGFGLLLPVSCP